MEQQELIHLDPIPVPVIPIAPREFFLVVAWQAVKGRRPGDALRIVHLKSRIDYFFDSEGAKRYAAGLDSQWTPAFYRIVLGGE